MVLNIKNISVRYKIWIMKINYLKLKEVSKREIWKTINLGKYVSDELYQNPLHWKPDGYTMILLYIPEEKMIPQKKEWAT